MDAAPLDPRRHHPLARASGEGRLAANVMQFCRALRAAGLPLGPGQTLRALEAVETVGVERREDFYWALFSALLTRRDQREVFDQAFHIFWRNPDILKRMMMLMLPPVNTGAAAQQDSPVNRRVAEAFASERRRGQGEEEREQELEFDAAFTVSEKEVLRRLDFEQMTAGEIERAKRAIARMRLPVRPLAMRRFAADPSGPRIDLRRTLRQSLRAGGAGGIDLARKRRRTRPPPLVVICDISGSMSQYSRMMLHFLHAVTTDRDRVHSFVFGTRLTNISRQLRHRDVDEALGRVTERVEDWSGGTRIAACLHDFNRFWSRRVLGQGAVVLLITDGLERDDPGRLAAEMERLHKSCRRLIWLNPLLRYDAYAPRSMGARAMMRHVDDFRSAHSLDSLDDLVRALSAREDDAEGRASLAGWQRTAAAAE